MKYTFCETCRKRLNAGDNCFYLPIYSRDEIFCSEKCATHRIGEGILREIDCGYKEDAE